MAAPTRLANNEVNFLSRLLNRDRERKSDGGGQTDRQTDTQLLFGNAEHVQMMSC